MNDDISIEEHIDSPRSNHINMVPMDNFSPISLMQNENKDDCNLPLSEEKSFNSNQTEEVVSPQP